MDVGSTPSLGDRVLFTALVSLAALAERAEAVTARLAAESDAARARREAQHANDSASAALAGVDALTDQLRDATSRAETATTELATRTVELATSRNRTAELVTELVTIRREHERQMASIAHEARSREAALRQNLECTHEVRLGGQQAEARVERDRRDQAAEDKVDRLTGALGAARVQVGQTAALQAELDRLWMRLARLAAAPEASGSLLQAVVLVLLEASPDDSDGERGAGDVEEGRA
ncbi:hypothetical protein [Saccharothrix sp.]|uniref:hypothetical protein n=1 Tax=Saccharothrix sp. TaxID=1873460 RepID=UPI0028113AC5|nr:hypothetical protein [Saccharothrix sp.]